VEFALTKQPWAFKNGDDTAFAKPGYADTSCIKVLTNFGSVEAALNWRPKPCVRLYQDVRF